jgi:hypothetical protein
MQPTHQYTTGCFDLSRCYPGGFLSPESEVAEGYGISTLGIAF